MDGDATPGVEWNNGLFGCFDDFGLCILTFFLPCITAGKNAEKNGNNCFLCGFLSICSIIGIITRTQIRGLTREQKGIEGSCFMDFLVSCFCPCCALVQESKELDGFIPGQTDMERE